MERYAKRKRIGMKGGARRPAMRAAAAALLIATVWMVSAGPPAALSAAIGDARAMLEEWVETQRVISREKRDLALAKEMLNGRIELVRGEIESLREKIRESEKGIEETNVKRAELIEENEKLKEATAALTGVLAELETRTAGLVERLPNPVRERIKPLSRRIPDNPAETDLTLSGRFQNVVGILNEVNKANREIAVASEVRRLPDGTSAEVTALYVGIGHAYYVGANNAVAGLGAAPAGPETGSATAAANQWIWTPADEYAETIAAAVAILNNERPASFVRLPIEIH